MPLYEYRCPAGHVTEQLRKYEAREAPLECECGETATKILSAHHAEVDGIYSYEPNIGNSTLHDKMELKKAGKTWDTLA